MSGSGTAASGTGQTVAEAEAALENLARTGAEPPWRLAQRREALAAFTALPMPDPLRDEDWRRTRLDGLELHSRPVQALGVFAIEGLAEPARQAGAVACRLGEALTAQPELVRRHLGSALAPGAGKFVALAQALAQDGAFVWVPDGVELQAPLVVRDGIEGPEAGFGAFRHTVVVLGAQARAHLVVVQRSPADRRPGLVCSAVEVVLGPGAQLRYTQVQDLGPGVVRLECRRALVGRDAELAWTDCELGARLARAEVETVLGEPGGTVTTGGLSFGHRRQHLDVLQRVLHVARHTTSDLAHRIALRDRARSVFRGIVIMQKGCAGASSQQHAASVLLSPEARSDAIPSLFIDEDDVRAGHGATSGPVDERVLFYLMSRGIPRPLAERLVLEGFFAPVLARLANTPVYDELQHRIDQKIGA
ncbi:MAG: Fe-S cluster assembly protein SufD [Planctomycetota bacterium]|nr:MAG: Fe-S cluster assembly protein SufD [Planctomycetota bacterium]